MGDEYLFISDCHLDAQQPEISAALLDFLRERAADASRLYILGDLFEVWLGDDDPADEHGEVIGELQRLARDCDIFFMGGNRDFLVGKAFAERIGMTLLDEPQLLEFDASRALLLHGDILCTDDHAYQQFRAMVRNPAWIAAAMAKPLAERRQLAAQLRADSKAAMSEKSNEIMDVNADAVTQCFDSNAVDIIIHGHTHRPAIHHYASNRNRIVLGDWSAKPSYLSWKPGTGFTLSDPRLEEADGLL